MADEKKYLSKFKKTINGVSTLIYIKDAEARQDIADIKTSITGAMHWRGYTTTNLTDGATTNPIIIDEESYTAVSGDVVAVQGSGSGSLADKEFVFNGTKWQEYGSTGSLKALAFKDNASGNVTAAGSNDSSTVTFGNDAGSDFVTGYNNDGVAPSFSEGAFTPASLGSGFVTPGSAATFTEGEFDAGTLPSKAADTFDAGTLPSKSADTFSAGTLPSLGNATTGSFATEGEKTTYDEVNECLEFNDASTSNAVTAQGSFSQGTLPSFSEGSFSAGTLPSFTEGTFNAGTLPSKAADTFDGGTPTAIDTTKFSGGSKAADTFSAGSAATLATAKALTKSDTGTAAAQTFTGTPVSVTVS